MKAEMVEQKGLYVKRIAQQCLVERYMMMWRRQACSQDTNWMRQCYRSGLLMLRQLQMTWLS